MNEMWHARSVIVARGCARGRVRSLAPGMTAAGSAPDPRSPRGRNYSLACLIAIALCAFTAAGITGKARYLAVVKQSQPLLHVLVRSLLWR
jgi:hypothetical protein